MKTKVKIFAALCMLIVINLAQDSKAHVVQQTKVEFEIGNDRGPMCYDDNWKAGCKKEGGSSCSNSAVADC